MTQSQQNSAQAPLAAVTGATGFIGRHLVPALVHAGWRVRLLLRREPVDPLWQGLRPEVVAGELGQAAALSRLVEGADAIIHVAGLIKAARREQFYRVNLQGTESLARIAANEAPGAHFLHVSSLAAREPKLSDYAASKRAGEEAALALRGAQATVLRPPAVYGPGDRETLVFFQLARARLVPMLGPSAARSALIHVADLVSLLTVLAAGPPQGRVLTAADARPQGYSWAEVLGAAARAVGNPNPKLFAAPWPLLRGVAAVGDVAHLFGSASMLSSQKLRELRHLDWSVSETEWARPAAWQPRHDLESGFAETAAWYRQAGWL
ncbi:SDR family NAD(P)-dependent oxidoreductase [Algiphilus sp. W345]|uniref:SDR family NAD(P)-dependent oxidoreductase n=1 Tax=Banduia mediterranea TaxID=3075609 RepID=A0ABU2WMI1_9GAMM|nr:SDR family NAD(P)-dependent oxidoreductase [Algiphilus sp. W345]MDT0498763.1 SDR family NAD(P)-dependent oxidoreductase [Algiphilus sp. W345]